MSSNLWYHSHCHIFASLVACLAASLHVSVKARTPNCNVLLQVYNGTLAGDGCDTKIYVPDVFLMSIILFLGTFVISVILKDFKNSLFFPSKVNILQCFN